MWCTIRLVEHEEEKRKELVQSILSYVSLASFLTYRDNDGSVSYAIWFADHYLNYVLGLHAARPNLGGVEIEPSEAPTVLHNCQQVWEMEMAGYGGAELPQETGIRSATAALGTQITDIAYRLLVCHRVDHSDIIREYARTGGRPTSVYRKVAGVAAREAWEFLGPPGKNVTGLAQKPPITPKAPPYNNTRIILGANNEDHLRILQDSFPAGSIQLASCLTPEIVEQQATTAPKVRPNMIHHPIFTDDELAQLELIPTEVTEVPMKYGRPITSTTQAPIPFPDLIQYTQHSEQPRRRALYRTGEVTEPKDHAATPTTTYPIQIIQGTPAYPIQIMVRPVEVE